MNRLELWELNQYNKFDRKQETNRFLQIKTRVGVACEQTELLKKVTVKKKKGLYGFFTLLPFIPLCCYILFTLLSVNSTADNCNWIGIKTQYQSLWHIFKLLAAHSRNE